MENYQKEFKDFLLVKDKNFPKLLSDDIAVPHEFSSSKRQEFVGSRLSIYRNNVLYSLSEALASLYPVTRRIVGEDFFRALAKDYVLAYPPQDPVLTFYGEYFPEFIAKCENCQHLLYLKDASQLEWHCQCALHGADATIFEPATLSNMDAEALSNLKLTLHPTATFLWSNFPVDQIWEENQKQEVEIINVNESDKCYLLIYRKDLQVQVVNLQPTVYYLLISLDAGKSISDAWELAQKAAGEQALDDEEFSNILVYLLGLSVFIQRKAG